MAAQLPSSDPFAAGLPHHAPAASEQSHAIKGEPPHHRVYMPSGDAKWRYLPIQEFHVVGKHGCGFTERALAMLKEENKSFSLQMFPNDIRGTSDEFRAAADEIGCAKDHTTFPAISRLEDGSLIHVGGFTELRELLGRPT